MKMNPRFLLAAFFSLAFFAPFLLAEESQSPAVYGTTSTLGFLRIKNESYYSPFPAEPGSYVDVWLAVRNFGKSSVDAECRLVPSFPFSLDDPLEATRDLGVLEVQRDVLLKFHVRVDGNAVEGYNDLNFECRDKLGDSAGAWSSEALKIYVQPHDAVLSISSVETIPGEFAPGQRGSAVVSLVNLAQVALKDVRVKLDLSGDETPFVPIGGTSEAKFAALAPGEKVDAVFEVIPSADAASGAHKIPIQLVYFDRLGKQYSRNETAGFVVSSVPLLQVVASSDKVFKRNVRGKISLKIVNNGLSDVKLLWVQLKPDADDVKLLSPSQAYVGSISSDNYETVDFDVFVEQNATLPLELPVEVSFRDSSNKPFELEFFPQLWVFSDEDAKRLQLEGPAEVSFILIAVAGIAGLYVFAKFVLPYAKGLLSRHKKEPEK